jgi:RNA polymerase-binding transcription factor DksA
MPTSKSPKSQSKAKSADPKAKAPAPSLKGAPVSKKAPPVSSGPPAQKAAPAKASAQKAAPAKASAQKAAPAKAPAQKAAPAKASAQKAAPAKGLALKEEASEASRKKAESVTKKIVSQAPKTKKTNEPVEVVSHEPVVPRPPIKKVKLTELTDPFLISQRDRIFQLRDDILESMQGVAKDTLRARAEGSEASAFGMHQADAGSDAYDRDFALSLLSQEQDALYEIEEALKRMELGTYGVCEMSGKKISLPRLEALPFARFTVDCQAEVERQRKLQKARMPVTSLFGLTDEEGGESEEEDQIGDAKE